MLPKRMRAAVLHGVGDLRVEEVPVPEIGDDEALVRVRACGICASDIHYVEHGHIGRYVVSAPMILGHEAAGEVVAVGETVRTLAVGQRVALEPGVACGRCGMCKRGRYNLCPNVRFFATPPVDGAMAEYAVLRADFAHPIPASVTDRQAALAEPLAVGIHAVRQGGVSLGNVVLVQGGGPVGLLTAAAARAAGAVVVVTDLFPVRRRAAESLGAVASGADDEEVAAALHGVGAPEGADIVIDTSGNRGAVAQAHGRARRGGTVVLVGLPEDDTVTYHVTEIVDRELTIRGVFRYANAFPSALRLLADHGSSYEGIITHELPLEDAVGAVEVARTQRDRAIKVLVC